MLKSILFHLQRARRAARPLALQAALRARETGAERRQPTAAGVVLGWCLVLSTGLPAGMAMAGSLPEPVIDPTMGAADALRAPPQDVKPDVRTDIKPAGTMPQRQLTNSFQPQPIAPGNPAMQAGGGRVVSPTSSAPPPSALEASLQDTLQMLALAGARQVAPSSARVEVELGRLDPRLRLAPCDQIQPYLPPNQRMWGRTRIGIRCLSGPTKWNVSLPLTIRVFAPAYVAVADLPVGTELTQDRLRLTETDIAGENGVIFTQPDAWVGRHLAKGLMAGEALRSTDLKLRQWVQPGDRVQIQAVGQGYAVSGEGQAMGVGLEGQDVRVRFDNGRMVTGRTVGERKVEVLL